MIQSKSSQLQTAPTSRLRSLLRHYSIEATSPTASEIEELRTLVPEATPVYLSTPPGLTPVQMAEAAKRVRDVGLEPVPHVAARNIPDHDALRQLLARLRGEAAVTRVLVVGGDADRPKGPLPSACSVIDSDLLQKNGIQEIGISGYPDGHPKIGKEILNRALRDKLKSAGERDLKVHIVSQFCFEPDRITSWIRSLRADGIDNPIKVGVAGPSSLRGLARFALRCGVRTSFNAAITGKASQLVGRATPDEVVEDLAAADDFGSLGTMSIHLFSFGGLALAARWARDRAF